MNLSEWVSAAGGTSEAARLLGVTRMTVHHWLSRRTSPKIKTMCEIIGLSGGRVSFEEIIRETKPRAKKRGRR